MRRFAPPIALLAFSRSALAPSVLLCLPLFAPAGCGRAAPPPSPFAVTRTVVEEPPHDDDTNDVYESADDVDWEVPLAGGWGGPYLARVVAGALPPGVRTVDGPSAESTTAAGSGRPRLAGTLLEEGSFRFRLEVLDRGREPFLAAVADLRFDVARGAVRIVGATRGGGSAGESAWYPPGELVEEGVVANPDRPALATATYDRFDAIAFVVAGGVAPYECHVADGALPLGTVIPPRSTSVVGAPVEVRPDGSPFVVTVEAVDAEGATGRVTVQWRVDVPPLEVTNDRLSDGRCGEAYAEQVVLHGGVPPFAFDLVACEPDRDAENEPLVTWRPPLAPDVVPPCALVRRGAGDYPAPDDDGPDYRARTVPPEGLFLGDAPGLPLTGAGSLVGTPRRRGAFRLVLRARSALVPHERGQQAWRALDLAVAPADGAPAFGQDPAYTLDGAFRDAPPFARIAEAEIGAGYDPDPGVHPGAGLLLRARGGVAKDGLSDAPHASEVVLREAEGPDAETPGGYAWSVAPVPPDGALPLGMALEGESGVWRVADPQALMRSARRPIAFTVADEQLPLGERHVDARTVAFGVGPDRVVITESATSDATVAGSSWTQDDRAQTVRMLEPRRLGPVVLRDLSAGDLSPTHVVPSTAGGGAAGTSLAALLSEVDLLRVTVNASGWWDDQGALNANGARPLQHADPNRPYPWYGLGYDGGTDWQPSAGAVELPECTSPAVTHDPARGVYRDGGRLHAFDGPKGFGVFVIRHDGTLYLPVAFDRATFTSFGDGWTEERGVAGSGLQRAPQAAVSPDGRWAAMKLRTQGTSFLEPADATRIVVFSLAGERAFDGQTFRVLASGSDGGAAQGRYLYAASLTLTNRHLYWICGNAAGSTSPSDAGADASWHGHLVYRWEVARADGVATGLAPAGALLTSVAADPQWANAPGKPVQTPFQKFEAPGAFPPSELHLYDGADLDETSAARRPFRVSRDGRALVMLASNDPVATTHADVMNHHVWIDLEGEGVRRLSAVKRRAPGGTGRGYGLGCGPDVRPHWLRYAGPTPGLEVSDDATRVAVVVNRRTGSVSADAATPPWFSSREDVVVFSTDDGWKTSRETFVTGDDAGGARTFATAAAWRFGALTFTADGKGLVFWGGFSSWNPAATTAGVQRSTQYVGTLWGCDLSAAPPVVVTSLLPTADGGSADGVRAFSAAQPYAPPLPTDYANGGAVAGVVKPVGGFLSGNRLFLYLVSLGPLSPVDGTTLRLVGVNLRSVDPTRDVGGHPDFRAFAVSGWPARRGFLPNYHYYATYPLGTNRWYAPGRSAGGGRHAMAVGNGVVFFATHHQRNGPTNAAGSSSFAGPVHKTYWGDEGAYGGEVEAFSPDVGGPVARVSTLGPETAARSVHFVDPSRRGEEVALVFDADAAGQTAPGQERVVWISGVRFDEDGVLVAAPRQSTLESLPGRAGDALAFDANHERLFYAFRAGAPDETDKQLVEATLDPQTGAVAFRRFGPNRRYVVLGAGR